MRYRTTSRKLEMLGKGEQEISTMVNGSNFPVQGSAGYLPGYKKRSDCTHHAAQQVRTWRHVSRASISGPATTLRST